MTDPLSQLIDKTLQYLQELAPHDLSLLPSSFFSSPSPVPLSIAPQKPSAPPPLLSSAAKTPSPSAMPIAPPKAETPPLQKSSFSLHLPPPTISMPFQDFRTLLPKIAPHIPLFENIPSDLKAKKIKTSWSNPLQIPEVPLLVPSSLLSGFYEEVARAVTKHFFPSSVLDFHHFEENGLWDKFLQTPHLKAFVTLEPLLQTSPHLLRLYHPFPHKKEYYLGKCPVIFLEEPVLYTQDPALKRSLWHSLCLTLKPLLQ
ncbi:MAG: hypothetical protein FJZ63_01670 [Chlamydiae bacterium]|nr:hypothetical protein [Chlamydiota bacterium]